MIDEKNILSTYEDVLSLYPTNRINQQKNAKKYIEAIRLKNEKKIGSRRISKIINMNEGTINYWLMGKSIPRSIKGIKELENILTVKIIRT